VSCILPPSNAAASPAFRIRRHDIRSVVHSVPGRARGQWDAIATRPPGRPRLAAYYHRRLSAIYRNAVPPGSRVLEVGCGAGDLLAALSHAGGTGIDFSPAMIAAARTRHLEHHWIVADAHHLAIRGTFDVVILSDLIDDLWDVQTVLAELAQVTHRNTRIILNFYSDLWELPLRAAQRLGLANPLQPQNWLTTADVKNLLGLADLEAVRSWNEILLPVGIPVLSNVVNRCFKMGSGLLLKVTVSSNPVGRRIPSSLSKVDLTPF
jgi:Methylase involved in ubiquinone/menaquinone biosynthesis